MKQLSGMFNVRFFLLQIHFVFFWGGLLKVEGKTEQNRKKNSFVNNFKFGHDMNLMKKIKFKDLAEKVEIH